MSDDYTHTPYNKTPEQKKKELKEYEKRRKDMIAKFKRGKLCMENPDFMVYKKMFEDEWLECMLKMFYCQIMDPMQRLAFYESEISRCAAIYYLIKKVDEDAKVIVPKKVN